MLRIFVFILAAITSIMMPLYGTAQSKDFTLKTVVIDAGHGCKDPGATLGNVYEKDIVLDVALRTGELIQQKFPSVNLIYTRRDDTFVPLAERANIANKAHADLFISIHVNYFQSSSIYGAETYILGNHRSEENLKVAQMENSVILLEEDYSTTYQGFDPNSAESYIMFELIQNEFLEQSRFFADQLQKSFVNKAQRRNRGVRQAGFLVLRRTSMPGVLVELGFLSNLSERIYLISDDGKQKMAQSIFEAFASYKKRVDARSKFTAEPTLNTRKEESQKNRKSEFLSIPMQGKFYSIQILASRTKLKRSHQGFKNYEGDIYEFTENGWYKYSTGHAGTETEAKQNQIQIRKTFKEAFLISFQDGKKR